METKGKEKQRDTALETEEIIIHLRKILAALIKIFYRSIRGHPFVWGFVVFLLVLNRYHPFVFGFVISSSPVIFCTALLLGILLIYGDANVPERKREQTVEGFRAAGSGENNGFTDDEFSAEVHRECKSTYSNEDSDVASSGTSQDQESDDDTLDEEIENQEDEEDEAQEKEDANEQVLKWTADDQKNVMDVGTLELERNQRLENLIVKRRARKFLSFHTEKNLIDLDSMDPMSRAEDGSRFNFQIPSISAPRRNPFDIPFEEETMGLPPIPGSAPSILQPRHNPFDIPYDQVEDNSSLSKVTMNQQFVPSPQRHTFFQRHESFVIGSTSSADTRQQTHDSIFKPYFATGRMDSEGSDLTSRQRKENVALKTGSPHDSDTTSSDMDQEDHKELVEPEVHSGSHLLPLRNRDVGPAEGDGQSSEEVDTTDAPPAEAEVEIRRGGHILRRLDAANLGNLEVIDERYDGSSSSSSEVDEKHSKVSHESRNRERRRNNTSSFSTERVGDSQISDPVYDSSPSAGKEGSTSGNSVISDVQTNYGKGSLEVRSLESDNGVTWVAAASLSYVDEIESKSREINEIKEDDVIRVERTAIAEEFNHPVSPVLSKFVLPSRLSFLGGGSTNNTAERDAGANNGASSKSALPTKPLTPREISILSSERHIAGAGDLPPIPEENSEYN